MAEITSCGYGFHAFGNWGLPKPDDTGKMLTFRRCKYCQFLEGTEVSKSKAELIREFWNTKWEEGNSKGTWLGIERSNTPTWKSKRDGEWK